MTVNHRAEAEKHLDTAARHLTEVPADMRIAEVAAALGQGHAALARSEETAATAADMNEALLSLRRRFNDTRTLVSKHVAEALASREKDRWSAAKDLTRALDEAHCNVDDLVDAHLADDGWDPRAAYKTPAGEGGWIGYAAEKDAVRDPWAPTPDLATQIPEPVRRVLAEYLAAALLSKGDARGVGQTITFALKHAGADLTPDIEKQITTLTLGADPSDPPF
ncbi:hypothetical protein [Streptomyces sp. C3-3]|uniref:hypothetical protein n=1 Tax=Streptomyces sp. C3-3 TaxID=2824901 RepID=UPI001B38F8A7|nr:hypothetical protein [Streptomyces sp. C3-3]MBQ1118548.1 hypothetical protein [Streptomyces sp. C3-3]